MTRLPARIVTLHNALQRAGLPHAFGGALALAWCTERARGTIDIDVNVFVDVARAREVFRALPRGISWDDKEVALLEREGQLRLWWEKTPVDLFLNTTDIHEQLAERVHWETFARRSIPFLSCADLAIFKAFFNRTKDWADLEDMQAADTLDARRVIAVLVEYLGANDERVERLRRMTTKQS